MTRSVGWISTEMRLDLKCIVLACSIWVFSFIMLQSCCQTIKSRGEKWKSCVLSFLPRVGIGSENRDLGWKFVLVGMAWGDHWAGGWLVLVGLEAARPGSPNAAADISPLTPHHNIQHSNTPQTQVKTQIHEYTKVILLIESNWRCCRQTLHFQIHCHSYKEEESPAEGQTLGYNSGEI